MDYGSFVLGGWFSVYLSAWARNRKRLWLRYRYRYGETVMAHIGADCIACIVLHCVALRCVAFADAVGYGFGYVFVVDIRLGYGSVFWIWL